MNKNIYLIQDWNYRTESIYFLKQSLREVFARSINIHQINREGLSHPGVWDPQNTALVIVPPVIGQKSLYNELFTEKIRRLEYRYIEHGGSSVRICAGAYHAFEKIHFTSPTTGEKIIKNSSTPHIKGTAFGTLPTLGRRLHSGKNQVPDSTTTQIKCTLNGEEMRFKSFYANGCSFELNDNNVSIFAEYEINGKTYPAAIKKEMALGQLIAMGIEPHHGYQDHTLDHLKDLNDQLKDDEDKRKKFMTALWALVAQKGIERGIITDSDLIIKLEDSPQLNMIPQ